MLSRFECLFVHEDLLRRVFDLARMLLDSGRQLGLDAGVTEDVSDLLCLGDALGESDLHQRGHSVLASSSRGWSAPPLISLGPPRSSNRSSMISKSLGTTDSPKTERASSTTSRPAYRVDRCVSASSRTSASFAIVAAWSAVEWSVSAARSRSSSQNVASCTSRSA